MTACTLCRPNSSTAGVGHVSELDCRCEPGFYRKIPNTTEDCEPCPRGFDCSEPGGDTTSIVVLSEYWRPTRFALQSRLCPTGESCDGGTTNAATFTDRDEVGCANGTRGAFCEHCADDDQYFDERGGRCRAFGFRIRLLLLLL